MQAKTVLITGARGQPGLEAAPHLEGRFDLRLLDVDPRGTAPSCGPTSPAGTPVVDLFRGVDVVVHLAADATAQQTWRS